jgi:long-chain fatty acid transport protein
MKLSNLVLALASVGFASSAFATNGYFSHGYGMKAKGMGGAATATAADTFGGAVNPAKNIFVGNKMELGVEFFTPIRESTRTGSAGVAGDTNGPFDASVESDKKYFLIPEFGYNKIINPNLALGVTVYGNGGMNTHYEGGQISAPFCGAFGNTGDGNLLCGSGRMGVDLMQLVIAPVVSYKVAAGHAIGISPLLGVQTFEAKGIQPFAGFSTSPANISNNDKDTSTGMGVRVGYMGQLAPSVVVGAAYSSKLNFSKMDDYSGLFANGGDFDIPENYNLGIAFQVNPKTTVAVDLQRINYSKVGSVSNSSSNLGGCMFGDMSMCLGGSNGAGFGWRDVNVFKLGVEHAYSDKLVVRAGYNHGTNPIRSADVTFNMLAPGVIEDHLSLGFTYAASNGGEWTMAYTHAFENEVSGTSFLTNFGAPPTTAEKIKMHQDAIGIAYSWKM